MLLISAHYWTASRWWGTQVRREFRKHPDVTDPRVVDLLVFKGQQVHSSGGVHGRGSGRMSSAPLSNSPSVRWFVPQELEETNQFWKQKSHLMRYFQVRQPRHPSVHLQYVMHWWRPGLPSLL